MFELHLDIFRTFFFSGFFILSLTGLALLGGLFAGNKISSQHWKGFLLLTLSVTLLILAYDSHFSFQKNTPPELYLSAYFSFELSNRFLLLLVTALYIAVVALFFSDKDTQDDFEKTLLLLFSFFGSWIILLSRHMLPLYMGFEIQSLCFYILLTAGARKDIKSSEAGIKYFILSALSSCFLLFGIALYYGFTHTFVFDQASPGLLLIFPSVFIFGAMAFKISASPFHMWKPDVLEGSPTLVAVLLSTLSTTIAMGALLKFSTLSFSFVVKEWHTILTGLAFLSILWGALGALRQTDLKRFIAYSSINHAGFMLLAISCGTTVSIQALLAYMTLYNIMLLGLWASLSCVCYNGKPRFSLADLSCLAHQNPLFASLLAIFLFSFAGIPPLAGFFSKFFIFEALIAFGSYKIAALAAILSVLSAVYYLRIIKVIYFDEPKINHISIILPNHYVKSIIFTTAFITLAFFLYPNVLFSFIQSSAQWFINHQI